MKFGICTSVEKAADVKAAGWEYVEENVQGLLQGTVPDAQWQGKARVRPGVLPVPAANCLVPGNMKIVGPDVDREALQRYLGTVLQRSGQVGMQVLVFGSGAARNVPDGFDREQARQQIVDFLKDGVGAAKMAGVTLVAEPLNKHECNIINTVAEAMEYVRAVDHPNFQCLVDSYHFWLEDEPLENLKAAMPWIKHVHVADKDGRVAPGLSGKADYVPFFRVLKQGGYDGLISFEGAAMTDFKTQAPQALEHVRRAWDAV
ncbi:MAG TPA: sugar phosphate isomerase/epimerase family protein [Tepidisphaeraceae bacterium]|nr:sugar phosphate isomerase/epimerase family protein [Tepidisphaeraceae bacterium]